MSEDNEVQDSEIDTAVEAEISVDKFSRQAEWITAREYFSKIGPLSELFIGCSRRLIHCYEQENGKLSKIASSKLQRLFGSPSMISQLFFAIKTYYPHEIESRQQIEASDMIFFINLYELSLFITIGYSSRRISKFCSPEDWQNIITRQQAYCDIAMSLGATIPVIGPSRALMTAAGKFLGWGLFMIAKPEEFKNYRIQIKMKDQGFDLSEEVKIFGTTHLHVACLFWQKFGYGVRTCEEYMEGLLTPELDKISVAGMKFRVAQIWLESLIEKKSPPSVSLGEDYDIEEKKIDELINILLSIQTNGSKYSWLSKTRDDISETLTPDLSADYTALKKAAEIKKPR